MKAELTRLSARVAEHIVKAGCGMADGPLVVFPPDVAMKPTGAARYDAWCREAEAVAEEHNVEIVLIKWPA